MANVLGELFSDIAASIRGGLGDIGTMKPSAFPGRIDDIVEMLKNAGGGESGSGDSTGGELVDAAMKITSGQFKSNANGYRASVEHGLGTMPDLVIVSLTSVYELEELQQNTGRYLMFTWSMKNDFGSSYVGGYTFPGLSGVERENDLTVASSFRVYCPNATTFQFGNSDTSANGRLMPNATYTWVAISGMGKTVQPADLCYVTFKNNDGTVEYGKKAVATGDDCANPITRGIFTTPTKASTAQYNYTFAGWATTPNGGLDSNALKAVTEDRTVYANFISALRYYTVTYYDSDGTTVLKTESLAYGTTPSYMPTKEGCSFNGWEPELAAVVGDTAYTAQWQEKISFANSSWTDIAKVCEAGEAANNFSVGDMREIRYNANTWLTAVIVGMSHDDLADGTGKAGISVVVLDSPISGINWGNSGQAYPGSPVHTALLNTVLPNLESDLVSIMKPVVKDYDTKRDSANVATGDISTFTSKIWSVSLAELNVTDKTRFVSSSWVGRIADLGTAYEYFVSKLPSTNVFTGVFYTRNHMRLNGAFNGIYVTNFGASAKSGGYYSNTTSTCNVVFGFCI